MVLDWVRSVFGEASGAEIALVGLWFGCVVVYKLLPRLGEMVGAWLARRGRQP